MKSLLYPTTSLACLGALLISSPALAQTESDTLLVAPAEYDQLLPRAERPVGVRFLNLYYVADNAEMRGPRNASGVFVDSGEEIAMAWRGFAAEVRGVFVERDALFTQQDHPVAHDPYALMLPPSWITVATADVARGSAIRRPTTPGILDDASWATLTSPQAFGSFPVEEELIARARLATAGRSESERQRVFNARRSLHQLAQYADALAAVSAEGYEAVAQRGAELLAESDRRYFGDQLRSERIIPLAYFAPTESQRQAGSGLVPEGAADRIPDEIVTTVRDTIIRRRMADGEIAIGTYDISNEAARAHLIEVLRGAVPRGDPIDPGLIWVFVTGAPGPDGEPTSGLEFIATMRREARAALVNPGRVDYVSAVGLPMADAPGGRASVIAEAYPGYDEAFLLVPAEVDSADLRALIETDAGTAVTVAPRATASR